MKFQMKHRALTAAISGLLSTPSIAAYYDNGSEEFKTAEHKGSLGYTYSISEDVTKLTITDYISQGRVRGSNTWHQDYLDIFKFDANYSDPEDDFKRINYVTARVRLSTQMQAERLTRGIEKFEIIEKQPSGAFKKIAELEPELFRDEESLNSKYEIRTTLYNKDLGYEYFLVVHGERNDGYGHGGSPYTIEIDRYDIGDTIQTAQNWGGSGEWYLWENNVQSFRETINSLVHTNNYLDFGRYRDDADLYKVRFPKASGFVSLYTPKTMALDDTITLELLKNVNDELVSVKGPVNANKGLYFFNLESADDYYVRVGFTGSTVIAYPYQLRMGNWYDDNNITTLAVSNPLENSCGASDFAGCYDSPLSSGLDDSGAVYTYQYYSGLEKWYEQDFIKSPNPDFGDRFGDAAFFTENDQFLVISAPGEDNCGTGVNGTGESTQCYSSAGMNNNEALDSGAVYIYTKQAERNGYGVRAGIGKRYQHKDYIKAPVVNAGDNFGAALSTGNQIALVGAPGVSSLTESSTGWLTENQINSQLSNVSYDNTGAVFQYGYDENTNWALKGAFRPLLLQRNRTLEGYGHIESENFGAGITNSGDGAIIAISAPGDARCADGNNKLGAYNVTELGISGLKNHLESSITNCTRFQSGAVWIYEKQADNSYQVISYLKAPNTKEADYFGEATWMTSDGEFLAVGAPGNDSGETNTNGWVDKNHALFASKPWNNTSKPNSGAVYLYKKKTTDAGSAYELVAYIKDTVNATEGANFGASIFLNDNLSLIIGSPDAVYSQEGHTFDNGYAHHFKFNSTGAFSESHVIYPNSNSNLINDASRFGSTVLMKNDLIFIGEPGDDTCGAGVNGESLNVHLEHIDPNGERCTDGVKVGNSGAVQIYNAQSNTHQDTLKAINPGSNQYPNRQFGGVLASNSSSDGSSGSGIGADPMGEVLSELLCHDSGGSVTGQPFFDWLIDSFICDD